MKKYFTLFTIFAFLLQLYGCYTPEPIIKEEFLSSNNRQLLLITTNENLNYQFEADDYIFENDTIKGKCSLVLENGAKVDRDTERYISINDIDSLKLGKLDWVKTTLLAAIGVGFGILVSYGIKSLMESISKGISNGIGEGLSNAFN